MATLDEITKEKERVGEALARVDVQREKLVSQLSELEAAERVLARYGKNMQPAKMASARTPATAKKAAAPARGRGRRAQLIEPRRSGPCSGNRQDAAGNHRCMQERPPKPCRRRDCPAQAGRPRRRARWEAVCHTADRDGATRRNLRAGTKRASADSERSRSTCLSLYGAVWTGRPCLRREVSSNVVRVAGRLTGTGDSNPFSSTCDSYKPDHSDRSGAGRRAARQTGECRWIGGNADDDHSQRNPPP